MPGTDSAGGSGGCRLPGSARWGRGAPALLELLACDGEQLRVIAVGAEDGVQALLEAGSPCSVGECGGSGLRLAAILLVWVRTSDGRRVGSALTALVAPGLAARRRFALEDVVVQRLGDQQPVGRWDLPAPVYQGPTLLVVEIRSRAVIPVDQPGVTETIERVAGDPLGDGPTVASRRQPGPRSAPRLFW